MSPGGTSVDACCSSRKERHLLAKQEYLKEGGKGVEARAVMDKCSDLESSAVNPITAVKR